MTWRIVLLLLLAVVSGRAQAPDATAFEPKALNLLSQHPMTALGERALTIRTKDWKHAETTNFVLHYFTDVAGRAVASESEFYYRTISTELERNTKQWERKGHVFIFEEEPDWAQFKTVGGLEPWSGGIHSQGELFLMRDTGKKFKGNALAHELTHLIVYRFFGAGVPRWLHEGLAEYTATRWYASYWRSRGYRAFPRSQSVDPTHYIPLSKLTSALSYPSDAEGVIAFYNESERLVRFLTAQDKHRFAEFLENMARGARFESALDKSYGTKFFNVDALEKQFKPYAEKDYAENPN
jgi:hypothetical protein